MFYEPVLIVYHNDRKTNTFDGARIAVGAPGSGSHSPFRQILADLGIRDGVSPDPQFVEVGGERAIEAIRAGDIDTAVVVASLELPWISTVFSILTCGWKISFLLRHLRVVIAT